MDVSLTNTYLFPLWLFNIKEFFCFCLVRCSIFWLFTKVAQEHPWKFVVFYSLEPNPCYILKTPKSTYCLSYKSYDKCTGASSTTLICNDRLEMIDNLASEVWKATKLCKVDASDATFAKVQPAPPSRPWKRWCRILRRGPRWRRPVGTLASCCSSWEFPVAHCCTPRLARRLIQNQCHETRVFQSPSVRNHKEEHFETLWWMRPPFAP